MNVSLVLADGREVSGSVNESDLLPDLLSLIKRKGIEIALIENKIQLLYKDTPANALLVNALNALFNEDEAAQANRLLSNILNASWSLPQTTDELIKCIANMPLIERDAAMKVLAKEKNCTVATLKTLVKEELAKTELEEEVKTSATREDVPYEGTVNVSDLYDEIRNIFNQYLYFSEDYISVVATLWAAQTWHKDNPACNYSPLAQVTAPMKGCGKSEMMFMSMLFSYRPVGGVGLTAPLLSRIVQSDSPSIFIDEYDTNFVNDEAMRGIVDAGVDRRGAKRPVLEKDALGNPKVTYLNFFGPVMLGGIGKLHETLTSRAVVFRMVKAPITATIANSIRLENPKYKPMITLIQSKLAKMRIQCEEAYANIAYAYEEYEPGIEGGLSLPKGIRGRRAQVWTQLFISAHLAGPKWVDLLTKAAIAMEEDMEAQAAYNGDNYKIRLIKAIHAVFYNAKNMPTPDFMSTEDIIAKLTEDNDSPWNSFGKNNTPINPMGISNIIREFQRTEIKSEQKRIGNVFKRGWNRKDIDTLFNMVTN